MKRFKRPTNIFFLSIWHLSMVGLYSRGRPTSLVLLLRVQVSKLSFPLSCHPSLCLHNLLCFAGASRGLVALRGVEVLEIRALRTTIIVKVVNRVRARSSVLATV